MIRRHRMGARAIYHLTSIISDAVDDAFVKRLTFLGRGHGRIGILLIFPDILANVLRKQVQGHGRFKLLSMPRKILR